MSAALPRPGTVGPSSSRSRDPYGTGQAEEPLVALLLGAVLTRLDELHLTTDGRRGAASPPVAALTAHERPTMSVPEAAAVLGISRALAYELVRRGEIPAVRLGRRIIVPRVALDRLFRSAGGLSPRPEPHLSRPNP